ncbi:NACHT domain-containing protein [Rhodopseudomonas thermotolerans]|uniref:NACHT domain-containing protein n=2 Tax=Rhodopseudomonas TaxID=1073 RepID=A0A336JTB7_9BRAD|nr:MULTISPECIES: NACHT domain-containing protein [Rhodopseudomonas]RED32661.1 NACHT domain-containing protein [Rhodopseudomonas pentothenatexigens]REF93670.1 NACHT domain-containing protein [Rhodopseudomonas thermotolerans]SSW91556.1 NACHT domain-containing protein [Rhodopseudomonas pentothenatexigens]
MKKTKHKNKETAPQDSAKAETRAGGAATASGMNFQAAVTAVAVIHMARGTAVGWLDGLINDVPVAVRAETAGAGDDIQIECIDGEIVEAQVKRGLSVGPRLWEALIALSQAISANKISFGVLVVCPASSQTIATQLSQDIVRLGSGAIDRLSQTGVKFVAKLKEISLDTQTVCKRLRIVRMHCLRNDDSSIKAAQAELAHICARKDQVQQSWDRLYRDAHSLIELKGRRTAVSVLQILRSTAIEVATPSNAGPVTAIEALTKWILSTTAEFFVVGSDTSLSLDTDWIKISVQVSDKDVANDRDLATVLEEYHGWYEKKRPENNRSLIEPDTLGLFYPHCVVVGGPGMGKSLLLKRLAREYAKRSNPVLRINLPALHARMKHHGSGFEEGLFSLGLDGSGLSAGDFERRGQNWILICDSLDECGHDQESVTDGLSKFAASNPGCKIVVATRPVGYRRSLLHKWRHYELLPLATTSVPEHTATLISGLFPRDQQKAAAAIAFARSQIKNNDTAKLVARSPLLLSMIAALAANGTSIGTTKSRLYESFFELIDMASPRKPVTAAITRPVLDRFLQVAAWTILTETIPSSSVVVDAAAAVLASELEYSSLKAKSTAADCLTYWQQVGLLERVSHANAETITFIHRSFAEYAAAGLLSTLLEADRAKEFRSKINQPSWQEVLNFAASGGLVNEIIDACDLADIESLKRALSLAAESDAEVSEGRLELLANRGFHHVKGERRDQAQAVGVLLERVSRRYPEAIFNTANACVNASLPWTRLVAWACLVNCGSHPIEFAALVDALRQLPKSVELQSWNSLGGFRLANDDGRELLVSLIIAGCRLILERCSPEESDEIVPEILAAKDLHTLGFYERIEPLLREFGKDYDVGGSRSVFSKGLDWNIDGYSEAWETFFHHLFAIIGEASKARNVTPVGASEHLPYVSAFLQMTSFWELPASNAWAWTQHFDRESVREVVTGALKSSSLPEDLIARDAHRLIAAQSLGERCTGKITAFSHLPTVDVWEMDYTKVDPAILDVRKLETALYQRCQWTIQVAVSLIRTTDTETRLGIVKRVLKNGRGITLWAAAAIAATLDGRRRLELLGGRLSESLCSGCEYLMSALADDLASDDEAYNLLSVCLAADNVFLAIEAARAALRLSDTADRQLVPLLTSAYGFWLEHEKPYPKGGGVVPDSPRALLLEAIQKIEPVSDDRLFELIADDRSDIRGMSEKWLICRLTKSNDVRNDFLNKLESGSVKPNLLTAALREHVPFSSEQLTRIRSLLNSSDARMRYAAMGVLVGTYLATDEILAHAEALRGDTEQDIRDRAYRIHT